MKNCTHRKRNLVFTAFLFLFALGAMAQPSAFQVQAKYYPDAGFFNSTTAKVCWGTEMFNTSFDFESGDIPFYWDNDVAYPWVVTTLDSTDFPGCPSGKCLMSGNKGVDNSMSSLQATVDFVEAGTISFFAGCFGETSYGNSYDLCTFYIDSVEQFSYGGIESWDTYTYQVSAGSHTFIWSFSKDVSDEGYGDAFFLDDVVFTGLATPAAFDIEIDANTRFNIYLDRCYGVTSNQELIASNVSGNQFIDENWLNYAEGSYEYGVEILGTGAETQTIYWSHCLTKPDIAYYHINVTVDPVDAGTVSGGGTYGEGQTITLRAKPNIGYSFNGWYLNGEEFAYDNPLVLSATDELFSVSDTAQFTAHFELGGISVDIYADPEEGGTVEFVELGEDDDSYPMVGDSIVLIAKPNHGYKFVNWTVEGIEQHKGQFVLDPARPQDTIILDFDFLNRVFEGVEFDEFSESLLAMFTAHFEKESFEITTTSDPLGGGTVSGAGLYRYGDTCTLTATPNIGYYFWSWLRDQQSAVFDNPYSFTVADSAFIEARFQPNYYHAYVISLPEDVGYTTFGDDEDENERFIKIGDTVTLHAYLNDGYEFVKWTVRGWIEAKSEFELPTDSANYTFIVDSVFLNNVYASVEENLDDSGNIAINFIANYKVSCKQPTQFEAIEVGPDNATFSWIENGISESWDVYYRPKPSTGATGADPYQSVQASDTIFMLTDLVPSTTYQAFVIPSCGIDATNGNYDENVASATIEFTTTAGYEISVTCYPEGAGIVTGTGTYLPGDSCTLTVTTKLGYMFSYWAQGNDWYNQTEISFVVTGNVNFAAYFSTIYYSAYVNAMPEDGGTPYFGDDSNDLMTYSSFVIGDTVTLNTSINDGFVFDKWTVEGESYAKSAFTLAADSTHYTFLVDSAFLSQVNESVDDLENGLDHIIVYFTANFNVACEQPTELTATEVGTNQATLSWIENANADLWYVYYHAVPSVPTPAAEPDQVVQASDTIFILTNLQPHTTYQAFVVPSCGIDATNGNYDENLASTTIEFTTEALVYSITATANPSNGGTITGGGLIDGVGEFENGETCTLTALPSEGYIFVNWTENTATADSVVVSTDATLEFVVEGERTLFANFQLIEYYPAITAYPEGYGYAWVDSDNSQIIHYGEEVILKARPYWGYRFVKWTTLNEDGNPSLELSRDTVYNFTMNIDHILTDLYPEGGEIEFIANFELDSFKITATANPIEGGAVIAEGFVNGVGTFEYLSNCEVKATPSVGYHFMNWSEDGEVVSTDSIYIFQVTDERFLVANFEIDSYEVAVVTIDPIEGGTITGDGIVDGSGTFNYGDGCTLTAVPSVGYHFVNWIEDGQVVSTTATYSFTVTGAVSLTAHFALNSYTITATADPTEGGTVRGEGLVDGSGTYNHFSTCELTARANEGYTFTGWSEDGTIFTTDTTISFSVEGARTLVANFTLNSYEIEATANPTEGGTIEGAGTYYHGEDCTLTAIANEGYSFINWTKDGSQVTTENSFTFTVTEAGTYEAEFSKKRYTITAKANPEAGGTVTGTGSYEYGSTATVTATAADGYTFVKWTQNGNQVSTDAVYSFTVTGRRTLVANFTLNSYEITATAEPAEGGTVTGEGLVNGTGTYNHGETCTLTATAAEGYTFAGWTEDGEAVGTAATYEFTVTGARTLVATFELNSYEIVATANPSNGGTVDGAGTYNYGESCTLKATSNNGYTFERWTENGMTVSTDATYEFTVTGARTLVARFTLATYEITATANPTEGGTVEGAGTYNHFFTCTLTATAAEGYTFVNWTKDNEVVSTDASYSFVVTEAAAYVANFSLAAFEIKAKTDPEDSGDIEGIGFYNYGETCTLTVIPFNEYQFVNWTLNGQVVSEEASFSFVVTESCNYVAHLRHWEGVAEHTGFTVSLFPNPAKYKLNIEASEPVKMLEIYTINGALVSQQSNCSEMIEINVENFAIGTYVIRLTTDSAVEIRKFVKK